MKKLVEILLLLLPLSQVFPQTDSTFSRREYLENILEQSTIDKENSQLYDLIEQLFDNPINVNTASVDDLLQIPFLDFKTARIIIDNRDKFGEFFSLKELLKIEGIDKDLMVKVLPFLTVRQKKTEQPKKSILTDFFKNADAELRVRAVNDIQKKKGFDNDSYKGSDLKNYNRLKLRYSDKIQLGLLTDKDPGEKLYTDFLSAHISVKDLGFIQHAVVGDFAIEFGQGLALWSPYAFSKGSEAVKTVYKKGRGIVPYTSSFEAQFLRGAAAKFDLKYFILSAFYSNNKIDANIDTSNQSITSIQISGFHRTDSEINNKRSLKQKVYGSSLSFNPLKNLNLEFLYYHSEYGNNFSHKSVFDLTGDRFNFTSASYGFYLNNFYLSGEFSYNGTSVASINNLQISFTKNFIFITSIRNYPRNYYNIYSNGFGERSNTQNEFGIYTGFRWRTKFGLLNFYFDQFKFPYATFSSPLPTEGNEFLVDYFTRPFKKVELRLRYKNENKEVAKTVDEEKIITDQLKQQARIEIIFYPHKTLRFKTRAEYSSYFLKNSVSSGNGFLIFQDLFYTPAKNFQIAGRIIIFDTDSFDSRIYEFENDLRGILTNNALYGKGFRWYLLFRFSPVKFLFISAKYSETYKPEEESLGSGLDEINGNVQNRVSLQIDLRM